MKKMITWGGGGGGGEKKKRERGKEGTVTYLTLHFQSPRLRIGDSCCIRLGSDENHYILFHSLIAMGTVARQCP